MGHDARLSRLRNGLVLARHVNWLRRQVRETRWVGLAVFAVVWYALLKLRVTA